MRSWSVTDFDLFYHACQQSDTPVGLSTKFLTIKSRLTLFVTLRDVEVIKSN